MGEFKMPSLGADVEAATVVEWRVKPGDAVKRGDVIAEVETDKGLIEIETWEAGIVDRILVQPSTKVPVGTVLAILRDGATAAAPPAAPATAPLASPAARSRARELGIELAGIKGSGRDGAITISDVESGSKAVPGDRGDAMRRAIAAAMSRSKREIPHYYLSTTVDMGRALDWLAVENAKRNVDARLLPVVLLVKAAARAVLEVPGMNGFFIDGAYKPGTGVHVGFAIALRQGGLVAPALHDADRLSLDELMKLLSDLISRAKAGSLKASELADPTITVTSLGDRGVETVFGVIHPPQVAIVGFGKIVDRPVVLDGKVVPRPVTVATLAADHRVTDGHRGGLFLSAISRLLQSPEAL